MTWASYDLSCLSLLAKVRSFFAAGSLLVLIVVTCFPMVVIAQQVTGPATGPVTNFLPPPGQEEDEAVILLQPPVQASPPGTTGPLSGNSVPNRLSSGARRIQRPAFGENNAVGLVRIKDVTEVRGDRVNQLTGMGLVSGLNNTGGQSPITRQLALVFEQRLGQRANPAVRLALDTDTTRSTNNLSAVTVTAKLPAFAKEGSEIDVVVAVWDDASSLQGGNLLTTPLYGVDGEVYAVAAGPISIGGFSFSGQAGAVTQNHPTTGRIPDGATIELETCTDIGRDGRIQLLLANPDYETAARIAAAINVLAPDTALAMDPGTVNVLIPDTYLAQPSLWVGRVGNLLVSPDTTARVVINERTGTVVIGENVRLSRVLITHANLTVTLSEAPQVSQPNAFSDGQTAVVPRTQLDVSEDGIPVTEVDQNVTVGDLAYALNALGVAPRDLSSIFQQLKESGALHADLEFK
ncbi:MAG: flagellar basal body P-ring protein FlgI [Fuerstiella sp.]